MFTGIVQDMGRVINIESKGSTTRLGILSESFANFSEIGDSISVNGVCLTITAISKGTISFDLSEETLKSTNLGNLRKGDMVNLELSLKVSDRLGGHLVTGHIDGVGRIKSKRQAGETMEIEISAPQEVMKYIVKKGSIAVDGISLTVVNSFRDSFTVVIIPHTKKVTTMGHKGIHDSVNLETDIIGKYVYQFLCRTNSSEQDKRFLKKLKETGFL